MRPTMSHVHHRGQEGEKSWLARPESQAHSWNRGSVATWFESCGLREETPKGKSKLFVDEEEMKVGQAKQQRYVSVSERAQHLLWKAFCRVPVHVLHISVSLVQEAPPPRNCSITTLQGPLLSLNPKAPLLAACLFSLRKVLRDWDCTSPLFYVQSNVS